MWMSFSGESEQCDCMNGKNISENASATGTPTGVSMSMTTLVISTDVRDNGM